MYQPSDFLSRIKDIARRQTRDFGHPADAILKQWVFLLCVGFLLSVTAAGYAVYRFSYWGNLEERVFEDQSGSEFYNQEALDNILEEFDSRAEKREEILEGFSVPANQGSATSTSSEDV